MKRLELDTTPALSSSAMRGDDARVRSTRP